MTLPPRHRIQIYSNPGSLRPSLLLFGLEGFPQHDPLLSKQAALTTAPGYKKTHYIQDDIL